MNTFRAPKARQAALTRRALCAAGFAQTTIPGPRGVRYGDRFERDGVRIDLQTERDAAGRLRVVRAFIDTPVAVTAEVGHG